VLDTKFMKLPTVLVGKECSELLFSRTSVPDAVKARLAEVDSSRKAELNSMLQRIGVLRGGTRDTDAKPWVKLTCQQNKELGYARRGEPAGACLELCVSRRKRGGLGNAEAA
jgi:hypothetical protein